VEYVTCRTCKSPDTDLKKGENRLFFVTCNSCGSRRSVAYVYLFLETLVHGLMDFSTVPSRLVSRPPLEREEDRRSKRLLLFFYFCSASNIGHDETALDDFDDEQLGWEVYGWKSCCCLFFLFHFCSNCSALVFFVSTNSWIYQFCFWEIILLQFLFIHN
jgi:hypothetical protein